MKLASQTQFILLLLLGFVIGFGWLAKRIKVPYPIVLVIAGLIFSAIPHIPRVSMSADFIFLAVLPPLLYHAAFTTSWRDFRYNLVSILSLALGLVCFTVIGIALVAHMLLPWFDWRLGLVLGAIAAPTDAIAATSIAKRIGLPQRIIDVLEGESLVNDATGLLALEFTTALVVTGQTPTIGEGLLRFLILSAGGIGAGLAIGKLVDVCERYIDDGPIEVTLSFVTPYLAYIGAEAIHGSGVLAAVAAGFYLGNRSSHFFSSSVRIQARSFWNTFGFVLNGIVFLLIGLQLPYVLAEIRGLTRYQLTNDLLEFIAAIVLLRLVWVFPAARGAYFIRKHLLKQTTTLPTKREIFVEGWTGMRGAISLAAAIALPETLANGQPFPQRNVIIFLTYGMIFATLVVQGLSLPPIIKILGLGRKPENDPEELMARRRMSEKAVTELKVLRERDDESFSSIYDDLEHYYERRLATLGDGESDSDGTSARQLEKYRSVSLRLRKVEREAILAMRDQHEISDHVLRTLEHELDLSDAKFT